MATFSSYDVAQDTWESLPGLPEPRAHVGGSVVDGTFFWPMPTPLHGTGAATIGSTIYVPGGAVRTRLGPGAANEAFTS